MNSSQRSPRRDFLKWSGMAVGVLVLSPVLPKLSSRMPEVEFNGAIIRGTRDGKILASTDNRASWTQWMDFGGMIEVINLQNNIGQITATLFLGEHKFEVRSDNGSVWKT